MIAIEIMTSISVNPRWGEERSDDERWSDE
jgi:hypothetical protein